MLAGCDDKGAEDYYQKALQHRANGEIAASIIELKNALQADPDDAEARLLLGTVYLEVRDLAAAEKELYRARALGMASDRLIEPLVDLWLAQGDYRKILNELPSLRAAGDRPDGRALLAEAKAYQGLNRLTEARQAYATAVELQPDNLQARYGLAWTARRLGDVTTARSAIDAALRQQPDNPDFIAIRGDLDAAEGNRQQAEAGYRALLQLRPGNIEARVSLAGILFARRAYNEASEQLDRVLAAVPSHGNANYLRAAIAVEEEDYETAKKHSERAILTSPNHVPSLLIAASANYALDLREQAERHAARVLELVPGHEFAGTLQAAIRGRTDESAIRTGAILIDDFAHPTDVASYIDAQGEMRLLRRIGLDCLDQGHPATAGAGGLEARFADLRAAVDGGNRELALARARALEQTAAGGRGQRKELARLYLDLQAAHDLYRIVEDIVAGGAGDAEIMCLAGPAYLAAAEPAKARLAARSLTELMPASVAAYLLLAKAYGRLGDVDRHAESLAKAASIDPDYRPLMVERIRSALAQGDASRAADLLTRMGENEEYRLDKMDLQGGQSLLAGRYSAAAEIYQEALAADPNGTRALKWAYALAKAGEPEQSREALVAWLQDSGHDAEVLLALANKDLAAERYLGAAEGYSNVLLVTPNNVLALNNLAWTSLHLGEAEVAVRHAERAFRLAPEDARVVDTLGYALMRKGDLSRAKTILERAQALAPDNPQFRVHLAEALIGHGEVDEARRLLHGVLSKGGTSGEREQAAKLLNGLAQ